MQKKCMSNNSSKEGSFLLHGSYGALFVKQANPIATWNLDKSFDISYQDVIKIKANPNKN